MKRLALALALLSSMAANPARAAELVGLGDKCLDASGSDNGAAVVLWGCHGRPNQQWQVVDGTIRNAAGQCLDVSGGQGRDGQAVVVFACHGRPNQQWQVQAGTVRGLGGKCLDVKDGSGDDGARLVLWGCHGRPNQRWQIR